MEDNLNGRRQLAEIANKCRYTLVKLNTILEILRPQLAEIAGNDKNLILNSCKSTRVELK